VNNKVDKRGGEEMIASLFYLGHMMHGEDGGWFWMTIMMVFWALVAILLVFLLIRYFSGQHKAAGQEKMDNTESPLDIAKRRLASGEITHEEYDNIANKLKGT
jgi:uncharacterized membrane protein